MEQLKNMEIIRKAFAYLKEDDDRTLKELLELVQIPAPSGFEQDRAVCIMDKTGGDDSSSYRYGISTRH